jgi:YD repeat-containing protein
MRTTLLIAVSDLGLSELIIIPTMLADLPRELRETHDMRYFYDDAGQVVRHEKAGTRVFGNCRFHEILVGRLVRLVA